MALGGTAARVSVIGGERETEGLVSAALTAQQVGCDDFWPAFARHIARLSTDKDRALLEELAAHPERRKGHFSWGLQYIVRGDVLLPDGKEVMLDELCDEAGVPRYPLLEVCHRKSSWKPKRDDWLLASPVQLYKQGI